MAGAVQLVRHFAKCKIPMAMCSGSDTFEFEAKMKNQKELIDLITLRVSIRNIFLGQSWF